MQGAKIVLVPVDYEPASLAALETARELAPRIGCEITLIHIYNVPAVAYPGFDPVVAPTVPGEIARIARTALENFAAEQGIAHTMLREGDPATEILRAVEELSPALVAMGTHGRSGLAHLFVGSVAEKVVRGSRAPVLTVHAKPE